MAPSYKIVPALRDRDGDRCHLCELPIWFEAPRCPKKHGDGTVHDHQLHPCAPSVDHLKPRCRNGTGQRKNLKLAHRWCNSHRGFKKVEKFQRVLHREPGFILNVKWPLIGMGLAS